MISKTKTTALTILLLFFAFSFEAKSQGNNKAFTEWPELKAFHQVMAQTFHPSEEGNLKPIRERSGELHEKAVKLSASKIPADLNKPEVKSALKELTVGTKNLNDLIVKKASDEEVKKLLSTVHDSFHKIVGLCSNDEHHEEKNEK